MFHIFLPRKISISIIMINNSIRHVQNQRLNLRKHHPHPSTFIHLHLCVSPYFHQKHQIYRKNRRYAELALTSHNHSHHSTGSLISTLHSSPSIYIRTIPISAYRHIFTKNIKFIAKIAVTQSWRLLHTITPFTIHLPNSHTTIKFISNSQTPLKLNCKIIIANTNFYSII